VAVLFLLDVGLLVLDWLLGLFTFLPAMSLPSGLSVVIPVPLVGSVGVNALNAYVPVAIATTVALVVGKALQWLYSLVPFKAT
jgi:hypothetical protein